ncbi:hypothetical protein KFU94_30035 [Chloroflexi bacterium TSY]|nr:hypothetical protein [Chloroflexi bacterium TSY]
MNEIVHDDFQVVYDPAMATIVFTGMLRLPGAEYEPIAALMDRVTETELAVITLDLRELSFLNSYGINIISRFVMKLEQREATQLVVRGNGAHPWQAKSLRILPRLMRAVTIEFE